MNINKAYALALEEKTNALESKKAERIKAVESLKSENNEYLDAVNSLKAIGPQIAIATLTGDNAKLSKLKTDSVKYTAIKSEIEKRAGIGDIQYDCALCNDTGYIKGEICPCIKKLAGKIFLDNASIPVKNCRFENFNLDYYDDKLPDGSSPKKRMTLIFKTLKEYSLKFSRETNENFIFFGATGLGKTHLSLSIMYELVSKGFNVFYSSAFNLFSRIENEHFNHNTDDTYNDALGCDLLIIDDLGSEFLSNYSLSVLYNIINTRLMAEKPMIINTNLSISDIESRYTPRISSRIMGEFTAKQFIGADIRQKKKFNNK